MEKLLEQLVQIYEMLQQVYIITTNQGTVLLQPKPNLEAENEALTLIEEMVNNKEQLISEITEKELLFDQSYIPFKGKINESKDIEHFKDAVNRILDIKEAIVTAEKNNILIMHSITKQQSKQIEIRKQAKEVADAYRKQQTQS